MKLLFSFIKNKSDKMGRIELTNLHRVLIIGANGIFSNRISPGSVSLARAVPCYRFGFQPLALGMLTLMLVLAGQHNGSAH